MTQHRDFATGDILPAGFLDALQEYLGTGVFNFRLDKATADPATAIKVVAGDGSTPSTGNAQVSIAIMGQWRYRRTALSASAPGGLSVGTHDIFVTGAALSTAQEDAGTFDYTFGLELKASGGTPATSVYRKVGTFVWDGSKITGINQTVGTLTSSGGTAGGDLTGLFPNPTITTVMGFTPVRASTLLSAVQVRDVGASGQVRAGRDLAAADFTSQGLNAPLAIYNLAALTDASGNALSLTDKGSVAFAAGIGGVAGSSAQFTGSGTKVLYRADTGGADPLRIGTGSFGCWACTAKRATTQVMVAKTVAAGLAWTLEVDTTNVARCRISLNGGSETSVLGVTDITDDRWHHVVAVYDGNVISLYVDGRREGVVLLPGTIFATSGPFNIGGARGDGSTNATTPHFGRIDEAFVTADALNEDHVRNLYSVRVAHTLAAIPTGTRIMVRRCRRGGILAVGNFPSTPLRLYNLAAASLADIGSGGVALTSGGGGAVAGPDGKTSGAWGWGAAWTGLSATDAGLPSGTTARSYGVWFATTSTGTLMSWGTKGSNETYMQVLNTNSASVEGFAIPPVGTPITDGRWHHAVAVQDPSAIDGLKTRLYIDGRCVGSSTSGPTSVTLAGAGKFRVGAAQDGTSALTGQLARAFVFDGALTSAQVRALYNFGTVVGPPQPRPVAEHVEALSTTDVLAQLDALDGSDQVDLVAVAA